MNLTLFKKTLHLQCTVNPFIYLIKQKKRIKAVFDSLVVHKKRCYDYGKIHKARYCAYFTWGSMKSRSINIVLRGNIEFLQKHKKTT